MFHAASLPFDRTPLFFRLHPPALTGSRRAGGFSFLGLDQGRPNGLHETCFEFVDVPMSRTMLSTGQHQIA